jgi:hypothetical protein
MVGLSVGRRFLRFSECLLTEVIKERPPLFAGQELVVAVSTNFPGNTMLLNYFRRAVIETKEKSP